MKITRVGVDIAKTVFHVHGVDRHGHTQWQAKLKRANGWMRYVSGSRSAAKWAWRLVRAHTTGPESFSAEGTV